MKAPLAAVAVSLFLVAGCGSSAASATTNFDATPTKGCMQHQPKNPSQADVEAKDVAHSLSVLRYYTANGQEAYCDAKPATDKDLRWMRLYVSQGADAAKVARWLSKP